ncbi:MAG: hypothetical protein HY233_14375 [Acidobacteriales bacterium]|nr:hypothetical protein [Terriglobales bacterium]
MKPTAATAPSPVCHPERSASPAKRAMRAVEGPLLSVRGLWERVNGVRKLLAAVLREIFDESAYERFLVRRQLAPSPGAYATFCRDHEQTKARRPRCC